MEASQTLVRNMETKREIREKLLQIRRNLPSPKWAEMSDEITAKISCHPWFQKADTIYGYLSYNQEVDTWPLLAFALQEGKKVAVPKVLGQEMEFYYIKSLQEVYPGMKGIFEPEEIAAHLAKDDNALIIMPLVGFDPCRNRLGYGGGYYDRYLKRHPQNPTMGIAFSVQEVAEIPAEETDCKPDLIITEEKEVR